MRRAEFLAVYLYELQQKLKAQLPRRAEEQDFIDGAAKIAWENISHIGGAIACYPPHEAQISEGSRECSR